MLTVQQKNEFTKRARSAGLNDNQIQKAIVDKERELMSGPSIKVKQPPMQTPPAVAPAAPISQPQQQKSMLRKVGEAIVQPAVKAGQFVMEASGQAARAIQDEDISSANPFAGVQRFKVDEFDDEINDLFVKNREIIAQARQTTDKKKKEELLRQSKAVSEQITQLGNRAGRVGDQQKTFFEKEENLANRGKILETGARRTAGAMSYAVPGGAGVKGALVAGAASGALAAVGEDNANIFDVAMGSAGGAVGGSLVPIAGKAIGATGKILGQAGRKAQNKAVDFFSDSAAENITKASPSAWQKAVEQHGLNINDLTKKYFSNSKSYDDFLGEISKRGRGGKFAEIIKKSEKQIGTEIKNSGTSKLAMQDFIKELQKEKKSLLKIPGNEANAAALDAFIDGFKARYGKGITLKQMLDLKRIADSRFGVAIADETTGSAAAQAQKMMANAAREKLKKLFPAIKDALDTETEVFTLQPILSRARAISNTRGSEIRVGKLSNVNLLNPLSWSTIPDVILSDEKIASRVLTKQSGEIGENLLTKLSEKVSNMGNASNIVGRTAGAGFTTGMINNPPNEQNNTDSQLNEKSNSDNIQEQTDQFDLQNLGQDELSIPQAPSEHPIPKFREFKSRDEMVKAAFNDGLGAEDVKELAELWDQFAPAQSGMIDEETRKVASSLRTEYLSQTKENKYMEATTAYRKVNTTPQTAAGDLSLIFAYMKLLDPTSVVRESEQELAQSATSLPGKLQNYAQQVANGKKLNEKQREEFRQAARAVYDQYKIQQQQIDELYGGFASQYGVDPSLVGIGKIGLVE